jgi:hypothetical protein
LIERASWRERQRQDKPLVLHADNGAAQKAHTLSPSWKRWASRPPIAVLAYRMTTPISKPGFVPASTRPVTRQMALKTSKWHGNGCSNLSLGTTVCICTAVCPT